MYKYKSKLVRIVDGDTFYLNIDLGLNVSIIIDVRLNKLNCPEIRGREKKFGKAVTIYVSKLFDLHENICEIHTHKTGKYGRYIADVYFKRNGFNESLKTLIIQKFPNWFIESESKMYDFVFDSSVLSA